MLNKGATDLYMDLFQILKQTDKSLRAADQNQYQILKELEAKKAVQQRLRTIQQLYLNDGKCNETDGRTGGRCLGPWWFWV